MPPRKSTALKPRGPPRTPPELRSLKASISFRADQKADLDRLKADHRLSLLCQRAVDLDAELDDAVSGPLENIAKMLETVNADAIFAGVIQTWKNENQTLKSRIADLDKRNADLGAQVTALKEIAVEGWAVAEFGGEQEGQDYHLYFRTWNIDRESYRKEALELLQAEHPEAFR